MPTVEQIIESSVLAEGPHWDIPTQSLYFVDIYGKKIAKYTPATKKLTQASVEAQVSFIIPVEGKKNEFVISQSNELVIISWDGESDKVTLVQKLSSVGTSPATPITFNDAKCDSTGRLWTGTHSLDPVDFNKTQPLGTLYSIDQTKKLKSHVDKIHCSNGLAFNDKTKKMFYIDSLENRVDRFDFDVNSGTISNREVWFNFEKAGVQGGPDGMTIDSVGNLWVAAFGSSSVLKVDGNKKETLLDTVHLPSAQVTSVAFGGPNLDELYVTTAALEFGGQKPPGNGQVYKVTGTGAKGLPASNFKLN